MKTPRLIEIDLFPNRDLMQSGLLLKDNREIFIMLNFDFKTKKFDGVSVYRTKDISRWRDWNSKEKKSIKIDNRKEFISKLDVDKMKTFYSCLKQVGEGNFISFFTDKNVEEYDVAQIKTLIRRTITVRLVDLKGRIVRTQKVQISDIDDFGFMTKYEEKIKKSSTP